jgi:hypothetical protein
VRSCFINMLWLSLLSCVLSAGALLLGLEGVATATAMAAVRLFALAGALFAAIALYPDLNPDLTSWLRWPRAQKAAGTTAPLAGNQLPGRM